MVDIIYDVDLGIDVKAFVLNNIDSVTFDDANIKKNILDSDDDTLLRVGKKIDSMHVVSLDIVDADFFKNNLFKNGNQD